MPSAACASSLTAVHLFSTSYKSSLPNVAWKVETAGLFMCMEEGGRTDPMLLCGKHILSIGSLYYQTSMPSIACVWAVAAGCGVCLPWGSWEPPSYAGDDLEEPDSGCSQWRGGGKYCLSPDISGLLWRQQWLMGGMLHVCLPLVERKRYK